MNWPTVRLPDTWDLKTLIDMKTLRIVAFFMMTGLLVSACDPDDPGVNPGGGVIESGYGMVYFDFSLPVLKLPKNSLHRVDLSLALTMDSLYRKQYCAQANVSDYKPNYNFKLLPGRYFYQAGITCSRQGDTCLRAGFPGGCYSIWWTSGWVDLEAGKTTEKNLHFQ